jgi:hypothetical protein
MPATTSATSTGCFICLRTIYGAILLKSGLGYQSALWIWYTVIRRLPLWLLPRDICPHQHLPRRHLPRRHLPRKTFAQMDICPLDICPERHLRRKTFVHKVICPDDEKCLKHGCACCVELSAISLINVNSADEGKLFCLKFNLEAGRQFYMKIASRRIDQSVFELEPCRKQRPKPIGFPDSCRFLSFLLIRSAQLNQLHCVPGYKIHYAVQSPPKMLKMLQTRFFWHIFLERFFSIERTCYYTQFVKFDMAQ